VLPLMRLVDDVLAIVGVDMPQLMSSYWVASSCSGWPCWPLPCWVYACVAWPLSGNGVLTNLCWLTKSFGVLILNLLRPGAWVYSHRSSRGVLNGRGAHASARLQERGQSATESHKLLGCLACGCSPTPALDALASFRIEEVLTTGAGSLSFLGAEGMNSIAEEVAFVASLFFNYLASSAESRIATRLL